MSRALNIKATPTQVQAACARRKVPISTIEALQSGGTRVVMNNSADAASMAKHYGSKIIAGDVTRTPTRLNYGGQ